MTVSLKHAFASARGDGADASLVQPSNWNAEHTLTLASSRLLGRTTSGTGAAEEISVGSRLLLSSGTLGFSTSAETLLAGALQTSGGSMTGDLSMGTKKITALGTPTVATDAATKAYADLKIAADGSTTITVDIPFGNRKITGLGAPVASTDAATKAYADSVGVFAWAHIVGGAVPVISGASHNVASVTYIGVGSYTIAFTTGYGGGGSYGPVITHHYSASDGSPRMHYYVQAVNGASFNIQAIRSDTAAAQESYDFFVTVLGGV